MDERPAPRAGRPHGLRITRVFDAPRERVWREWVEPERFADWFGGPDADVPIETVAMDVRLVLTISDRPGEDDGELLIVVLADLGDGRTEMVLEQHGTLPPAVYDAARNGWRAFFDRLAERLAAGA